MPRETRVNPKEQARRMSIVENLMLQGLSVNEIYTLVTDPNRKGMGWNLHKQSVYHYMCLCRRGWLRRLNRSRPGLFAKHIAQREALFRMMLGASDFRGALEVLKDIANLQGFYVDRKIVLSGKLKGEDIAKMSDSELRKLIEDNSFQNAEYTEVKSARPVGRLALVAGNGNGGTEREA